MSRMQDQRRLVPVFAPGRTRRTFPKQLKADAVSLVLDEGGRSFRSVAASLGIGGVDSGGLGAPGAR